MKRFVRLTARIDRASLRERLLVFATGVVILVAIWFQWVMAPLDAQQTRMAADLDRLRAQARAGGADDVVLRYAALKARQVALAQAIRDTDARLNRAQRGMIEPKAMVAVLTDVLSRQKNLSLVLLKNLPVVPLLPPPPGPGGAAAAKPGGGPYLHPVELVVRGNYLDVLAYIKALETHPWGFTWRRFEFKSTDHGPEYHIEFTTLSMQANWLGV